MAVISVSHHMKEKLFTKMKKVGICLKMHGMINYRECVRTCLSEDTTSAFMIIETVDPKSSQRLMPAIEELSLLIKEKLKGETEIFYLEKDRDEIVID